MPAGIYRLDSARSRLTARIRRGGAAPFIVRFERFDAILVYDPMRPEAAHAEVTIDPASFRNLAAARSPDLRTIAKWRSVAFVSNSFTRTARNGGVLNGNVSFFGLTKPVSIQLILTGASRGAIFVSGTSAISVANPAMIGFTGLQLGGDMQFSIEALFVRG